MKNKTAFIIKGNIIFSKTQTQLSLHPNSYLICENGKVIGLFDELPKQYEGLPLEDYGNKIIIPGLIDLHIHAPQFSFRGLGMDLELLDWLNTHTFPQEARYKNLDYAEKAYTQFMDAFVAGGTTRACIFATIHQPATMLLMEKLEKSGLITMVGKVNMDRNSIDDLCEESADASLQLTRDWIRECESRFERTKPILTPRFIPSCTDKLMQGIHKIQNETGLNVQTHLSENISEGEWVKGLCPDSNGYADAYDRFGLLGTEKMPSLMAHCVYSDADERKLLRDRGAYTVHCPVSNTNLSSGIAPIRRFLEEGNEVGLGTDVSGGFSISMLRVMSETIMASKLYWRLVDNNDPPLTMPESFYLATAGGGKYFGKVGRFDEGYEFDAVILDDEDIPCPYELNLKERLERLIYLGNDSNVVSKYVAGKRIK